MKAKAFLAVAVLLSLAPAPMVFAQPAPEGVKTATINGSTGFVNTNGTALYTLDNDAAGKSSCNGQCAKIWPPLTAGPDARDMGHWTVITRADGTRQWAYMGKPVYSFARDKAAGDAKGDNFGPQGTHVWHVVRP